MLESKVVFSDWLLSFLAETGEGMGIFVNLCPALGQIGEGRELFVYNSSQLPWAQNNVYVKVAYFGVS